MKCLFCNSGKIKKTGFPRSVSFNQRLFEYYACTDCKLVFIHPLPTAGDYAKMYAASYHDEFYFKDRAKLGDPVETVEKFLDGFHILDFGCGDGSFLKQFISKSFKCTGIEYQEELVQRLRNDIPGADFYTQQQFLEMDFTGRFSLVHLGDVLEHVEDPNLLLQKLHTCLKQDSGILFVEGPLENNFHLALAFRKMISWLVSRITKKDASHAPYHITFSNKKNQELLFKRNNYSTLYYKLLETGWPYPETLERGISNGSKYFIAKLSIAFSALSSKWGNRFIYIGLAKGPQKNLKNKVV